MSKLKLAVIPGDGIGIEVTAEALKVLRSAIGDFDVTEYDLGGRRYVRNGELLTDEDLASLREHDAILLGAIGDPERVPPGVLERGLLLKMRFALDHHVNLRPSKLYPGAQSPLKNPGEIDFVVVREGTEGAYTGNGGAIRVGTPHEVANETSVNTRFGAERVVRYAFDLAMTRRKKLTLVHKTNVLVNAGGMWQRTVDEVAKEYPEVEVDYSHIDAATIYLVTQPSRFDVIVTDNLFGDIITDEAGAISGGIGLAASGNIDASGANPSMFEPVHGSAPDIAGQGIADPTAAILSAAMMLRHLGREGDAARIEAAVEADLAARGDAPVRTTEVGDRIAAAFSAE
ncbi:3-isopropylmalate dehydrogenase [Corynebacterium sp.]|uniref:3-isopropylmalate dehydrogenase n=1 Tax=Corynebacterium sp. TaxID=1720 RepID=UPI0026DB8B15|nr:3-isopropylmalate dehydrogenase [Corynebacterium sp.]MDO4610072.1 3-isopropylmalate dehydrogenase [Corynebacterium sp.]